jgi:IclR family pca regulon transcriptional regulator
MPKLKRTEEEKKSVGDGREFIESLDRGLRVIQSFGVDRRPMTLSDIAKASNLPRATARRILMTLQKSSFVAGDERLFSLTSRVLLLASAYLLWEKTSRSAVRKFVEAARLFWPRPFARSVRV